MWATVLAGSRHVVLLPWLHSGMYTASISFTLDALSLSMATLVGVITLLVTRFSVNYLHREAGFQRFFMVLAIFTAAMQLIALSGSALLAFVGWELAGASSYLLIGYNWQSRTATTNATRAFVTNRIGDAGFLLGMFMAFSLFRSTEWDVMLVPQADKSSLLVGVAALGFMAAALVKSAQFPFSAWITRALEGPTPSSTVFYGSLMVHAGVYLLLRIHPLLEQAPCLQYLLLVVGILTVLYGWLGGLAQTDIKTSLMFSTLAQTGLMLVEISLRLVHAGVGAFAVARGVAGVPVPAFALVCLAYAMASRPRCPGLAGQATLVAQCSLAAFLAGSAGRLVAGETDTGAVAGNPGVRRADPRQTERDTGASQRHFHPCRYAGDAAGADAGGKQYRGRFRRVGQADAVGGGTAGVV